MLYLFLVDHISRAKALPFLDEPVHVNAHTWVAEPVGFSCPTGAHTHVREWVSTLAQTPQYSPSCRLCRTSLPCPSPWSCSLSCTPARRHMRTRRADAHKVGPSEAPIRQPKRGEWMGADKNSSRRRLKLWQDEPARSDPQDHTLRTSTFRLPTPRSHWSATGPRINLYQQPHHTRTHDSGNTSKAGCPEEGS
jgi:hypothetical protein